MNRVMRTATSIFALTAVGAFLPAAAFAAEGASDDAITVIAQRREEASVNVPITVTTLGSDALATANVEELSDIAKMTPALRFDFAGGYFQPTIRGVGTPVTSAGSQGNVGIYVDGFYSPNPLATDFDVINVQSIQVLKGPQGTLFGRNTTGGAILVQTADPSTETSGMAKFSYGRFNEMRGQAYATFGLSDAVAVDLLGQYRRGDGWQRNISNNRRVGEYENWNVRIGLWAQLSDKVEMLLRYAHGSVDDPSPLLVASYRDNEIGAGHPYYAQPGQFTFRKNEVATGTHPSDQEYFRSNSDTLQLTIRADLGFADLTSYSQYRNEKVDSSIELDYSGVEYIQLGLPNDNETWTQELLLTSKPGPRLQWTAGLFYFQNRDTYRVFFDYFPAIGFTSRCCEFGSSATAKSYAAFLD
ncbi:MAG: TonB-dependent receptor plug domain-containing protein, partial [Alteraurantiacibacter sp.]|nr:TonB-dependent receptor plug domain-containing protein [Alteraurantiacibacter sp.]